MRSTVTIDLNRQIPWLEVVKIFEPDVQVPVLPFRTTCVSCRTQNLDIYQDFTSGGAWSYCRSCGYGGDMLELASAVWSTDVYQTLVGIASRGVSLHPDC